MTSATAKLSSLPSTRVLQVRRRTLASKSSLSASINDVSERDPARRSDTGSTGGVIASTGIRVHTFGQFSVSLLAANGIRAPIWGSDQVRVLLKCLLAAPGYRLTREQIIEILWPEHTSNQGRDALRHALSRLRRALEPGRCAYGDSSVLGSNREEVWLIVEPPDDAVPPLWVDRLHFERDALNALDCFNRSHLGDAPTGERLSERARALYVGPFLPAEIYSDWAQETRARCERLWVALTRALADQASIRRRFEHALLLLAELFAALPGDEDAAARLMRMQAATGHRAEALRTYDLLRAQLDSHLGVQPTRELKELSQTIRTCDSQQELQRLLLAEPLPRQPLPLELVASLA
jgi:DNA-binding SARP family transcriptional activator